jgi:hypothetical protein
LAAHWPRCPISAFGFSPRNERETPRSPVRGLKILRLLEHIEGFSASQLLSFSASQLLGQLGRFRHARPGAPRGRAGKMGSRSRCPRSRGSLADSQSNQLVVAPRVAPRLDLGEMPSKRVMLGWRRCRQRVRRDIAAEMIRRDHRHPVLNVLGEADLIGWERGAREVFHILGPPAPGP